MPLRLFIVHSNFVKASIKCRQTSTQRHTHRQTHAHTLLLSFSHTHTQTTYPFVAIFTGLLRRFSASQIAFPLLVTSTRPRLPAAPTQTPCLCTLLNQADNVLVCVCVSVWLALSAPPPALIYFFCSLRLIKSTALKKSSFVFILAEQIK